MTKILVDTTYFLPLAGIMLEGIDPKIILKLLSGNNYQIQVAEITLFELAAKGAKLATETELTYQEVLMGIDTLRYDTRVTIQTWTNDPTILELAYVLRTCHADFIDCLVLATAISSAEIFATYDEEFYKKLLEQKKILNTITTMNPQFCFWFGNLTKETIPLKKQEKE